MKAVSAQVVSYCVYYNPSRPPKKVCRICMATLHTYLTFGPIRLFISFYLRAPWLSPSEEAISSSKLTLLFVYSSTDLLIFLDLLNFKDKSNLTLLSKLRLALEAYEATSSVIKDSPGAVTVMKPALGYSCVTLSTT